MTFQLINKLKVTVTWTIDTAIVENNMNKEIGALNSFRPFLMKYICAEIDFMINQ